MKETNLQIINRRIKSLECLVTADATNEESPLLKQLRNLREEIKNKAQLDYVSIQSKVLDSFRILMNQLTTLSYYASEADKDTKLIEKVISSVNKLKSLISEDLLKPNKEDENNENSEITSEAKQVPTDEDLKTFVLRHGAVYFDNFEKWCEVVKQRNLTICDEGDFVYSALDEEGACGNFVISEGEGCLFDNAESMMKAFDESVYTKVRQEAESLL